MPLFRSTAAQVVVRPQNRPQHRNRPDAIADCLHRGSRHEPPSVMKREEIQGPSFWSASGRGEDAGEEECGFGGRWRVGRSVWLGRAAA